MELTLLQSKDVTVTSTRFIVGSQTYTVREIDSADFQEVRPVRGIPIILLLVGLIPPAANYFAHKEWVGLFKSQWSALTPDQWVWSGVILSSLALAWLAVQSTKYTLILSASGGKLRVLQSSSRKFIISVLTALNQAIRADR